MKIVDIDTGEVLKEYKDFPEHIFFSTKKYWEEYEKFCKEYELKERRKFLFEEI